MGKNKIILLIVILVVLLWSGINPPAGTADWLLETSPIFIALLSFIIFDKYLGLSDLSYALIAIYLIFPIAASHYGVSGVSLGNTIGHILGTTRNMYDRLTHFLFGFLSFYPVQDIFKHFSNNKEESFWIYYIPLETILAFSAVYEIFEWLAAVTVNPILAAAFYGSQGDIFDTPKDMANAAVGALFAMMIVFTFKKIKSRLAVK